MICSQGTFNVKTAEVTRNCCHSSFNNVDMEVISNQQGANDTCGFQWRPVYQIKP